MKQFRIYLSSNRRLLLISSLACVTLGGLLLYKLGSLTAGKLSYTEWQAATTSYGWRDIYQNPLYLPLDLLRSIVYFFSGSHHQFLTRLPSAMLGALTIAIFAWLIRLWHGTRTAILGTLLFATSAWVLHVSRLASYDVTYLLILPALLLSIASLRRRSTKASIYYGSLLLWGALLYIPGAVWLIVLAIFWERKAIKQGWKTFSAWQQRLAYVLAGLVWVPLLAVDLTKPGMLRLWLGLPQHLSGPLTMAKRLGDVFVQLLVRGPTNPELWLSQAPLLDILTLVMVILGIYFYAAHWRVGRARILLSFFLVGAVLISLGGVVSLSLLVPLLYICAATGVAYLLHQWLQIFPFNPIARTIGISLVVVAISLSCLYNLRAYFVAWPHNSVTQTTFRYLH